MTPTERHPVRVVARHVLGCHLSTYTWFWIILLLGWGGLVTALTVFTDIRTSAWATVSTAAPKWFLLVLSIIAAVGALPMYLAQGITRRHFALASLAVGVPVALGSRSSRSPGTALSTSRSRRPACCPSRPRPIRSARSATAWPWSARQRSRCWPGWPRVG